MATLVSQLGTLVSQMATLVSQLATLVSQLATLVYQLGTLVLGTLVSQHDDDEEAVRKLITGIIHSTCPWNCIIILPSFLFLPHPLLLHSFFLTQGP